MIIHYSKATIPPRFPSSFDPFLQIILALNGFCGIQFHPPTCSDDLYLPFCLILILRLNSSNLKRPADLNVTEISTFGRRMGLPAEGASEEEESDRDVNAPNSDMEALYR